MRGITPTGPDPTFDSRVEDIVRRLVRAELGQLAGSAAAEARAQEGGRGLGIQNIRRGVGRAALGPSGANITVSATTYSSLSTPLELDVVLSGRPLRVCLTGMFVAGGGGGILFVDVNLRGESITGVTSGLIYTASTALQTITGEETLMAPASGPATLEVVAKRQTADGTIFIGSGERLALTAEEL